jgi:sterol desaturase/sphingolipid hydroxylase (fatty acid hydroxylase superfamily)
MELILSRAPKPPPPGFMSQVAESSWELGIRYAMLAGIVWLLCYVIFKRRWFHRKIIARFPQSSEVRREMLFSAISVVVFSLVGVATVYATRKGWTQAYGGKEAYKTFWFWCSIPCAAIIHDTWFYWTHRLMHHRRLFKWFHRTHHLSHNPTPWAAYAFDPLEAVVQAAMFPLVVMLMPMHYYAFGLFMLWQISFNIAGHTGYEFLPRWLMRTPLKWVLNTPTNHIMHHETLRGNYGLYFNVWDRLMGTNHINYEARFEEVTSRRPEKKEIPTAPGEITDAAPVSAPSL